MVAQVRLGRVGGSSSDDFIFPLRPEKCRREHSASYSPSGVAQADWIAEAGGAPFSWSRNNPSRITLDFLLVDLKQLTGSGTAHIEDFISTLEGFRRKDERTGEPPNLLLTFGQTDRVRIDTMTIDPRLWDEQLRRKQALVNLVLLVIRPGSR